MEAKQIHKPSYPSMLILEGDSLFSAQYFINKLTKLN